MNFIDSHAHLEALENLEEALQNAKRAGVDNIITIGTSIETSKKAIKIAEQHSSDDLKIYPTVGLHPGDAKKELEEKGIDVCINNLKQLFSSSKNVVAIGETGLDFKGGESDEEKELQKELFAKQIELAGELNLPVIIHCRNAWDEIFNVLSDVSGQSSVVNGVFHSFTGNWQTAQRALDLGFYVSFSGIVTFKNAKDIQESAKNTPLDRILIETDSPFLSPEPIRGTKNEPKNLVLTAKFLSNLKGITLNEMAAQTAKNTQQLFKLA